MFFFGKHFFANLDFFSQPLRYRLLENASIQYQYPKVFGIGIEPAPFSNSVNRIKLS